MSYVPDISPEQWRKIDGTSEVYDRAWRSHNIINNIHVGELGQSISRLSKCLEIAKIGLSKVVQKVFEGVDKAHASSDISADGDSTQPPVLVGREIGDTRVFEIDQDKKNLIPLTEPFTEEPTAAVDYPIFDTTQTTQFFRREPGNF